MFLSSFAKGGPRIRRMAVCRCLALGLASVSLTSHAIDPQQAAQETAAEGHWRLESNVTITGEAGRRTLSSSWIFNSKPAAAADGAARNMVSRDY